MRLILPLLLTLCLAASGFGATQALDISTLTLSAAGRVPVSFTTTASLDTVTITIPAGQVVTVMLQGTNEWLYEDPTVAITDDLVAKQSLTLTLVAGTTTFRCQRVAADGVVSVTILKVGK